MRKPLAAVVALVCIATAGCDDAPAPGPGTLTVSLASPNGLEGAARRVAVAPVRLALQGGQVEQWRSALPAVLARRRPADSDDAHVRGQDAT